MIVVSEPMPAIADRASYTGALERADRLFKTEEMRKAARFVTTVHERASDYLEQAPALAIAIYHGGGRLNGGQGGAALYAAHKINQLCERGAKLKEVMAAYRLPLPMRQLKARALSLADEAVLPMIAALPPSTIAQTIPNAITAQRRWLSALGEWKRLTRKVLWEQRWPEATAWLAVATARYGVRASEVGTVGDFLVRGDVPLNSAWTWARAMAAAEDWHDRISAGDAKRLFGVLADQVVCHGSHPDHAVVDGIEFVALRTPIAIHAEGKAMRHCVASYVPSVVNGACSIVSLRQDEHRLATLELRNWRMAQLKGRFNALPELNVRQAAAAYVRDLGANEKSRPLA